MLYLQVDTTGLRILSSGKIGVNVSSASVRFLCVFGSMYKLVIYVQLRRVDIVSRATTHRLQTKIYVFKQKTFTYHHGWRSLTLSNCSTHSHSRFQYRTLTLVHYGAMRRRSLPLFVLCAHKAFMFDSSISRLIPGKTHTEPTQFAIEIMSAKHDPASVADFRLKSAAGRTIYTMRHTFVWGEEVRNTQIF